MLKVRLHREPLCYKKRPDPSRSVTTGPAAVTSGYWAATKMVERTKLTSMISLSWVLDRKPQMERREVELRTSETWKTMMSSESWRLT